MPFAGSPSANIYQINNINLLFKGNFNNIHDTIA